MLVMLCKATIQFKAGFKTESSGDRSLKNLHKEVLLLRLSPRESNTQTFQSFLQKKYSKTADNTRNYAQTSLYDHRKSSLKALLQYIQALS